MLNRTYTHDTWAVPGLIPEVDVNSIEMMDENKRKELVDSISEHGDILQFVPNENSRTGEKWNDIVYNGDVVARIDMTTTQHVNISSDEITIGNLSLNNGLVRFFSNSENVETIIGVVGAVAVSAIGVNWSVHHPILARAAVYVSWKGYKFVSKISNIVFAVPKYFLKKIFPRTLSLENEDEEEVEDGLKVIIDWATYDETTGEKVDVEIELEDADKKVASLESCVKIANAFRDTLKGPIAIMCEEIKNMKSNKPSIKEESTDLTLQEGYPAYYVKNDDVKPDSNDVYTILKFDIPEEIKTKCLQQQKMMSMNIIR